MTDRIIIIEGEPNLRRGLDSALTEAGFTVARVRDYPEALQKLEDFKPGIAIVDEALPSGDGKDACYKLHNYFGIPVILLGVGSGGEAWMRAVEAGADFYFEKPVSYREAVARVKAILRRYKEEVGCSGNQGRASTIARSPSRPARSLDRNRGQHPVSRQGGCCLCEKVNQMDITLIVRLKQIFGRGVMSM